MGSRAPDLEVQHRPNAVAVVLKPLVGLVFGLIRSGGPRPDQIFAGLSVPVQIIPVMLERQDQPFFQRQRLGHIAVLHFVGGVVVADPLLRVFVQHHADVMAAIGKDHAGLPVGDDAAADFGKHLIVLSDVRGVLVYGLSPVRRRPP